MQAEIPARERDVSLTSIGSEELAEGLMLVRASTLKVVRFQLAMERQDRRGALEAVDDLVALDRQLQDYLADVPAAAEHVLFRHALDAERAMLNREKLALTAEIVRRLEPPEIRIAEPVADDDWLGPTDLPDENDPRRSRWWLAAIPVVASAIGAGAYVLGLPEAQAWLAAAMRGLQ